MRRSMLALLAVAAIATACTGVMGDLPVYECIDELDCSLDTIRGGGCFDTGIGHIGDEENQPGAGRADQDSFGGNAMGMRDGGVRGQWQNTTHLGDAFHGQAEWLRCWNDGGMGPEVPRAESNVAQWGGPGKWNHEEGYQFMVYAEARPVTRTPRGARRGRRALA